MPVVLKLWGAKALQVGRKGNVDFLFYFKTFIENSTYKEQNARTSV